MPPAGGSPNPSNQEHCNTLPEGLHGSSSQLKYVHVSLFSPSATLSSALKCNSYSISVLFYLQPTKIIRHQLDFKCLIVFFYLCISSMDWNIYYFFLYVASQAFHSWFLCSVLFFFFFCSPRFLTKPQKHKVGEDSNIDVWHLWQVIAFFVIICVASYSKHMPK